VTTTTTAPCALCRASTEVTVTRARLAASRRSASSMAWRPVAATGDGATPEGPATNNDESSA
jgi:hypothetical protein